jgi:hypothetical protein
MATDTQTRQGAKGIAPCHGQAGPATKGVGKNAHAELRRPEGAYSLPGKGIEGKSSGLEQMG